MALLEHFHLDLALVIQSYAGEMLDMPLQLTCWYEGNSLPKKKIPNLRCLIWKSDSLKEIGYYKNIVSLNLSSFNGDLSPLAGLISLTNLNLYSFNGDISPLAELKSLTNLDLSYFNGDISPLAGLISLTNLNLGSFKGDKSILKHLKCSF